MLLVALHTVHAATLTVDPSDASAHATIQDALDAASDGDDVEVVAGTYTESLDFGGKSLWLSGEAGTLLDATGLGDAIDLADVVEADIRHMEITGDGGGIVGGDDLVLGLRDVDMHDFTEGAVVLGDNVALEVSESLFSDNTNTRGGAIYLGQDGGLLVDTVTFERNAATNSYGGGIALYSGVLEIFDSTFTDNTGNQGGAVSIIAEDAASTWADSGSTYTGNEDTIRARGIASVEITDSVFTANDGRGMTFYEVDSVVLEGVELSHNFATVGAGAYLGGTDLEITDGWIHDNETYAQGTGLYLQFTGTATITDTLFEDNIGTAWTADGGAIYWSWNSGDLSVDGCTFSRNQAESDGGAIKLEKTTGDVTITNSVFEDNYAVDSDGGAIDAFVWGGLLTLQNNRFTGNEAGDEGGVLWYAAQGADGVVVENNVFVDNVASTAGVLYTQGEVSVVNNTLLGSEGGAARHGTYSAWFDLGPLDWRDNLVANTSGSGLEVADENGGAATVAYNAWWNNDTDIDGVYDASDIADQVLDDPGLSDTVPGSADSLLVDAGDPALLDLDGTVADIGWTGGPGGSDDVDGDGYTWDLDCNDYEPLAWTGATENRYDDADNDCDGRVDEYVYNHSSTSSSGTWTTRLDYDDDGGSYAWYFIGTDGRLYYQVATWDNTTGDYVYYSYYYDSTGWWIDYYSSTAGSQYHYFYSYDTAGACYSFQQELNGTVLSDYDTC